METSPLDDDDDDDNNDDHDDDNENDSADDALLELLGLKSMADVTVNDDDDDVANNNRNDRSDLPFFSDDQLHRAVEAAHLREKYETCSVCQFPPECSIPASHMRRLADELIWDGSNNSNRSSGRAASSDKTYETIRVSKKQPGGVQIEERRRILTRFERFVDTHPGWYELCHNYIRRLVSTALGVEMVLYKEKLNLKPPGGSGFAPHLDTPSLRVALGSDGPQTFCTVMIAIDDMTPENGCLRIAKGPWNEENCCTVTQPEQDGNPDAGGRAGAIPLEVVEKDLIFEDIACKGGSIVAFNGWAPHRSSANTSAFSRRAVFLTYNPREEGDFHQRYYERMGQLRDPWRGKIGLKSRQQQEHDDEMEKNALATIPTT